MFKSKALMVQNSSFLLQLTIKFPEGTETLCAAKPSQNLKICCFLMIHYRWILSGFNKDSRINNFIG